jgi:two-component system cell cycle sensor histidine kinase/response regulator CckA
MIPSKPPRNRDMDVGALLHELEVRQAELELQNQELIASSEELRRSNGALAVARDRFHTLYDRAPAPLITIDAGGQIIDVNRAAEALLRSRRDQLTERPLALFFAETVRTELRALLAGMFAGAPAHAADLVLAPDDALPVDVHVDGVVFRDDDGAHAVLSLVDLTASKHAEEERRTIERSAQDTHRLQSLGVLAGGIAHDFNNLLTVVLSGTDLVLRRLAGSPGIEPLREVEQAARQAGALAQQMLAYSGARSAPARVLDLCALIREVQALIDAAAGSTPVALTLAEGGGWICGDQPQLRQVVLNLVINASEAMAGREGAIVIAVEVAGEEKSRRFATTCCTRPTR